MDISFIIKRSLELAWKHKILWVVALLIGSSSFSGFNSGFSNTNREQQDNGEVAGDTIVASDEFGEFSELGEITELNELVQLFDENIINSNESSESTETAGGITNEPLHETKNPFSGNYLNQLVRSITPNLIVIGVSLFLYIAFLVFSMLLIKNWATGALLGGIDDAIEDSSYSIGDLGMYGRISTRELIKLRIYLMFIRILAVVIILLPLLLLSLSVSYFAGVIITLTLVLPLVLFYVVLGFSETFAIRFVALKGLHFRTALSRGFRIFKANVVNTLILSCSSCFIIGFAFSVTIGAFMLLLFSGFGIVNSVAPQNMLILIMAVAGAPLIIALLVGFYAMGAYFTTYMNFAWSMFFNAALKKEGDDHELQ